MGALALEAQHELGYALRIVHLSYAAVADIVVLAEHALQIAAAEEYCAGTALAADTRLLPHMQRRLCHIRKTGRVARAPLYISVYAAFTRAKHAAFLHHCRSF